MRDKLRAMVMVKKKSAAPKRGSKKVSAYYTDPSVGEYGTFGRKGTVFEGAWRDLAEAYGGVAALAEAAGVSYVTLYRWAVKGDPVPGPSRMVLAMLAAQKRLPSPVK